MTPTRTKKMGLQARIREALGAQRPGVTFTLDTAEQWVQHEWHRESISGALSELGTTGEVERVGRGVYRVPANAGPQNPNGALQVEDIVQMQNGTILLIINGRMHKAVPV